MTFNNDLEYSLERIEDLDRIYMEYFGVPLEGINHITDMGLQRVGIDTILTLPTGQPIRVQEKKRRPMPYLDGRDILIEYCSREQNGKCNATGWIYTCSSDHIAVIYELNLKVFILPVAQLKKAWAIYGEQWKKEHRRIKTRAELNNGYFTLGVAVPTKILLDAIRGVMVCDKNGVPEVQKTLFGASA
jgi:hypothetical protein